MIVTKKQSLLDLPISPLGYGCYALSGAYGAKLEEAEMIRILKHSYELGIRFYDTSSSYPDAEEILGKATKPFRNEITIASKVGLAAGNKVNLSKEFVKASCETSLKKLKTDYLDVYQVHYHDPNTPVDETLEALESLKQDGKIRCYGVGHLPFDKTIEYLDLGEISFVLAEMSPVSTCRYRELHQLQARYDFKIIAFSITGRGLLSGTINSSTQFTNNDIRSIDPLFKKSRLISGMRIAEKLREIGNRHGKTPVQLAISWTIQNPGVIVGLTGPTDINHLEENSLALNWFLDKESIEEINQFIEEEENKLRKIMYEELEGILNSNLSFDYEKTYKDLIYVMEHCIENKLMEYETGVNMYMEILKCKNTDNNSLSRLNEIKSKIKSLVNLN
ncbi:MAG: aldo/keto reductase [Gottschalkiaceae bacterium]|nr:MAG: aldo/keto reductase [Gottschalkiaceae bacterium]